MSCFKCPHCGDPSYIFGSGGARRTADEMDIEFLGEVWSWFQNRKYATKSKLVKSPGKLSVLSLPRDDSVPMRNVPHFGPGPVPVPVPAPPGRSQLGNNIGQMEFEVKSARDGASGLGMMLQPLFLKGALLQGSQ